MDQRGEIVVVDQIDRRCISYTTMSVQSKTQQIVNSLTLEQYIEHIQPAVHAGIVEWSPAINIGPFYCDTP